MNAADPQAANLAVPSGLVDSFGRRVTYLRLSVTDRCDLRCTYCMAENMTFLPKADLLTEEELEIMPLKYRQLFTGRIAGLSM